MRNHSEVSEDRQADQTAACAPDFGAGRLAQAHAAASDSDWITRLTGRGQVRADAIGQLHRLMLRAAWHRVVRMREADGLGAVRREEIVHSAADEATVSVLSRLETFEGRSRFTTWAYKFGILHAGVTVRRAAWSGRDVCLDAVPELSSTDGSGPQAYAEYQDLSQAVMDGLYKVLTTRQRRIAVALLIDEVPINVLAERLGTTRGALYKTLHEARKRLRCYLAAEGHTRDGGAAI